MMSNMAFKREIIYILLLTFGLLFWTATGQAQISTGEGQKVDIVLVIDNSGSMNGNDAEALRLSAAKLFIDLAAEGDRFGLVVMAADGTTRSLTPTLNEVGDAADRERLKELIENIGPAQGNTHMGDALNIAYELLADSYDTANAQRFVLLLTDGQPEPAIQYERVDEAMTLFQDRPDWPVYSIALGEEADVSYLKQAVGGVNGGATFQVDEPETLIDIYLQVYELVLDDRYIDRVTLDAGANDGFMSVDSALQINEVSLIAQRPLGTSPIIETLGSPNGFDLVSQVEETGDYLSIDKAYELYKISADSEANLIGRWDIELDEAEPTREIIALARSDLRTRFFFPASPSFFDERATRYVPSGRPFYLNVGAVNLNDAPVPELSPGLTFPSLALALSPTDDGQKWDLIEADGFHAAYTDERLLPGTYEALLAFPLARGTPLRLNKRYEVIARPLPAIDLIITTDEREMGLEGFIEGELFLAPFDDIQVEEVRSLTIGLRRPDGAVEFIEPIPEEAEVTIPPTPNAAPTRAPSAGSELVPKIEVPSFGNGRNVSGTLFKFKHPIQEMVGEYTIYVIADLRAESGKENIRYVEAVLGRFNYEVPVIDVAFEEVTPLIKETQREATVSVKIDSNQWRTESLEVIASSDQLTNVAVDPRFIRLEAGEESQIVELRLFTEDTAGALGEVDLEFISPTNSAIVNDRTTPLDIATTALISIVPQSLEINFDPVNEDEIVLDITSESNRDETLTLAFESNGVPIDDVLPRKFVVPAADTKQVTFQVFIGRSEEEEGELNLTFRTDSPGISLEGDSHRFVIGDFPDEEAGGGGVGILPFLALIIAIGVGLYLYVRRKLKE